MNLLLTPLRAELDALHRAFEKPDRVMEFGQVTLSFFGDLWVTAVGGHGKVQFALTSQMLIRAFSPELVICAGACGGLSDNLKPQDVVVAENTVEHDFRLKFIKRPLPMFAGDSEALQRLRRLHSGGSFNGGTGQGIGDSTKPFAVHFGLIASGDEDVMDEGRASAIHAETRALAVAWEGAGGARAAQFCETAFLEVRAVTDSAGRSALEEFKRNLGPGMANVADVLKGLV